MSNTPGPQPYELPKISEEVLDAMSHDLAHDPDYPDRIFHDSNESNHALMTRTVIEAHRQSEGDMSRQASFVKGAEFVLGALERHGKTEMLETLWGAEYAAPMEEAVDTPLFELDDNAA